MSLVHSPSAHTQRATAKPVLVRLSERERVCLLAINELGHGETGYGIFFKTIVTETGLTLAQVRRSVRACARKGLAEHIRGLFTDDGMIAGSGYGITPAGRTWVRTTTANSVGMSEANAPIPPVKTGEG